MLFPILGRPFSQSLKNYYHILEVAQTATAQEIKKAFRTKAKQFHPDLNPDPGAREQFIEVEEGYTILSDPQKRKRYDWLLSNPGYSSRSKSRKRDAYRRRHAQEEYMKRAARAARAKAQRHADMRYQRFMHTMSGPSILQGLFIQLTTGCLPFLLMIIICAAVSIWNSTAGMVVLAIGGFCYAYFGSSIKLKLIDKARKKNRAAAQEEWTKMQQKKNPKQKR